MGRARLTLAAAAITVCVATLPRAATSSFCAEGKASQTPRQLLPVDEASRQPDFFTFRAQLQIAVAARNTEAVVALTDPAIRLGFGGDDGVERFRQSLTGSAADDVWRSLARVLTLGGAFKGADSFEAPYYYSNWPDTLDSFECGVLVGRGIRVRGTAAPDAPVVATASYEIVRHMVAWAAKVPAGWAAVELASGAKGYVREEYLGAPTGVRAIFSRVSGQWRLTALVAGD